MKTKRLLAFAVVALLPVFLTGQTLVSGKTFLGKKAPKFVVEKWVTVAPDCKGKFVLIDFWATWCGPCRAAIPELNALHKKFGAKLAVIGLSDETEDKVRALKSPKIEYAVAIDTKSRMSTEVGVTGIPHVIIMDPQGIVRWEGFPFEEGHQLTEEVVKELLAAKPAAAVPAK